MNKKDLKIDRNTAVHCVTEELANKVLRIAHDLGYNWKGGSSYLENNQYYCYKGKTCYNLNTGQYSCISYYEEEKYNIISAEEFLKLHGVDMIKTDNKAALANALAEIERLKKENEALKAKLFIQSKKNNKQ